jgi:hypothetical protein
VCRHGFFVVLTLLFCGNSGLAQVKVSVTVDETKTVNVLTRATIGANAQITDGNWMNPQVFSLLRVSGITAIRYPNGGDGQADLYHWSTNRGVKWGNSIPPKVASYPSNNDFGHFGLFADQLGTAMMTVNYGSNMAGTGGGEPQEAAAWVAYANGDPASTAVIGKDSTGNDWKTVGYWAGMRASQPLASDDGYNFLRIAHPQPLGLKVWEIGNEVYNNGWFGGNHATETDLHAPYPASQKENDQRRKNPSLSPAFYGARLAEFSKAMKAVDPSILIGGSLTIPVNISVSIQRDEASGALSTAPVDDYRWSDGWNDGVLKTACQDMDFVSLHWHPGTKTLPPDWKLLDEPVLLSSPEDQLPKTVSELLYLYKKDCPAGHNPRVAFTEVSPSTWAKLERPVASALFAADTYALLAEMGTISTDWSQLRENNLLTDDNKPLPAYYGLQMLHIVAFEPGDSFVYASSNNPSIASYATRRRNGLYGVILINKDPKNAADVKVTLNGAQTASSGMRFEYGPQQSKENAPVARTSVNGMGNSFTVAVPAYSIVDILVPKAQ